MPSTLPTERLAIEKKLEALRRNLAQFYAKLDVQQKYEAPAVDALLRDFTAVQETAAAAGLPGACGAGAAVPVSASASFGVFKSNGILSFYRLPEATGLYMGLALQHMIRVSGGFGRWAPVVLVLDRLHAAPRRAGARRGLRGIRAGAGWVVSRALLVTPYPILA